ncbi:MAG: hypothetical protein KAS71_15465 [Bacteroidales bacterium]|nr:hypothetical protein [Bacteroidales bacterium]
MIKAEKIGKFRPLLSDKEFFIVSIRNSLYKFFLTNKKFEKLGTYYTGSFLDIISSIPLFVRLLRVGFHQLIKVNNKLIGIVKGGIVIFDQESHQFNITYKIIRGSRPLRICQTPDGDMFWGEYFNNPDRDEVNIYGSVDGYNWKVVYTFKADEIRHIHGLFYDQYRDIIWVLTGDKDHECGLWTTNDKFENLSLVYGGTQSARAVTLIPFRDYIIVPTDTPLEKNYIQKINLSGKFSNEKLEEVSGSVFNSYFDGNIALISTIYEKSEVNNKKVVELWGSYQNSPWKMIASFQPDFFSKISLRLFRYPEVKFQEDSFDRNFVLCYGISIRGLNNCTFKLKKADIIDQISNNG